MGRGKKKVVIAPLSIDPALYDEARRKRVDCQDSNFSRYVRGLIRRDLDNPTILEELVAQAPTKGNKKGKGS